MLQENNSSGAGYPFDYLAFMLDSSNPSIEGILHALETAPHDDYDFWIKIGKAFKCRLGNSRGCLIWKLWTRKQYSPSFCADIDEDALFDSFEVEGLTAEEIILPSPSSVGSESEPTILDAENNAVMEGEVLPPSKEVATVNQSSTALSDADQSDKFAQQFGDKARFCHQIGKGGKWYVWNGKQWAIDETKEVRLLAEKSIRANVSLFPAPFGSFYSLSTARIKSVVELAASKITINKKELDADPWMFNCANGVIDLRTGKLLSHDPKLKLSCISPATYNSNAQCPLFLKYLDQVTLGRKNLITFLQRFAGYCLTGITREHCFVILSGRGRNGKGTFKDVLNYILGDYASALTSACLMVQKYDGIPNELAGIEGKRLIVASETNENRQLDEAKIKELTGGDLIKARFLHREWFTYETTYKICLLTNNKPLIKGSDEGIWSRIRVIPFDLFLKPEERDVQLQDKLKAEASGILNWMLQGCKEWQESGLTLPDEVKYTTEGYRNDMDYISAFLAECIVHIPGKIIPKSIMHEKFCEWYAQDRDGAIPTKQELGKRLKLQGLDDDRSGKLRYWKDVQLIQ